MKSILILAFVAAALAFTPGQPYSVGFVGSAWTVYPGCSGGLVCAVLEDTLQQNGWYTLSLKTLTVTDDHQAAYAAGFLEAALTQQLIWYSWLSFTNNATTYPVSPAVAAFVKENDDWMRQQVRNNPTSPYWQHVGLVLAQWDGMVTGYATYAPASQKISYDQFLLYQLSFEIGDIQAAVTPGNELNDQAAEPVPLINHCSALVRLSPDGQQLFASQDTWSDYTTMLRIWKNWDIVFTSTPMATTGFSFSSYPGALISGDDYYVTNTQLFIAETTNDVMNNTLYHQYTTPQTIPYWIRVNLANRMADNGPDWVNVFSQNNNGGYNNQWIIVDYKLFTPGQPLKPNTLTIAEQIPGFVVSADQTAVLQSTGYWASYNVPFYSFIWNISGYAPYYQKYGNEYSHDHCARANVFRRDAPNVTSIADMKRIMRYNQFQTDPLALQDACKQISARGDLNTPWTTNPLNNYSAFGGIDSKITEYSLAAKRATWAVCGPTWDDQPPFAWNHAWASVPHYGQPQVFNFDFELMQPTPF